MIKQNQPIRILLIEDNPGDARLFKELLRSIGDFSCEIEHVDCLQKGLDALSVTNDYDVVLLDLGLPDGSGIDNCIRVHKTSPTTPIVILTGTFQEKEMAIQALGNGAQDYLTKNELSSKELARAVTYALERKRLEQAKDDFTNMVSHELRNPLTAIQGVIYNLKDELSGPLNPKQKEVVAMADKNLDHVIRLINDILQLSRFTSGKTKVEKCPLDLKPIIDEAVQNMKIKRGGAKIVWEEKIANLPKTEANPDMVLEIINNLLNNAGRFANKKVIVEAKETADGVQVSVIDDGPGIPKENINDLFTKFVQIQRPTKKKGYKGTGLGLAICKEIVELHSGKIWAESEEGHGATFHFTLPKA